MKEVIFFMKKRIVALILLAVQLLSITALAAEKPENPPEETAAQESQQPDEETKSEETEQTEETGQPDSKEQSGETEQPDSTEQSGEAEQPGSTEPSDTEEPGDTDIPSGAGTTLLADDHIAYMTGSGGFFRPDANISRAEAAQILYRLLPHPVTPDVAYTDVTETAWYAPAALALGTLGVIRPGETEFLPNEELTRGEFIRYLASFSTPRTDAQPFSDVPADHPDAAYLLSARAWGWLDGFEDGTARPERPITRAEAVTMINRALGRTADKSYIDSAHPVFYLDVAPGSWYYYSVVEASVAHEHTSSADTEKWTAHTAVPCELEDGLHWADGWMYYYDSSIGDVVRNASAANFYFNNDGHFTSGNDELDQRLRAIVMQHTNDGMTQEQKLRALYLFTRDSFKYFRRAPYAFGVTDFMQKDALNMLQTGYGNCYCYASVFWYLSRWIGYDSRIYSGTVGRNKAPHSWVEITFNGRSYIFDTELEMAYRKKGRYDVNLYKYIDVDGWRYVK